MLVLRRGNAVGGQPPVILQPRGKGPHARKHVDQRVIVETQLERLRDDHLDECLALLLGLGHDGVGEAGAYPSGTKVNVNWFPRSERAIAASPYVYKGDVKITEHAFNKTTVLKRISANHLLKQIGSFRVGSKDAATRADDCLDTFCYLVLMTRGSNAGARKGI